jgi:hydrogenase maturation protease
VTTAAGSTLVIGYGNTLRSDDGAGPAVVERLAADPRLRGADLRAAHQLTPELAADASCVSLLVLVDATVDEGAEASPDRAGRVAVRRLEADADPGSAWTHHLDPAGLIALSRELWGVAPITFVVSIAAGSLEAGDGLSPAVEAAIPRAAEIVAALVAEHGHA